MSRYVQKEHVTAEELMAMIEAAHAELSALCAGKRFRMCIPVEADDSDVVIGDALRHSLRFVKAASASSSVPEKWQSIETAPKDGGRSSVVILSDGRFVWTGYFAKRWYPVWVDAPEPTHWQPLPAPPVSSPVNKEPAPMHWSVEVTRNGESLVTIESNSLSGKPTFSAEDEDTIRNAARHLLAFIGEPHDIQGEVSALPCADDAVGDCVRDLPDAGGSGIRDSEALRTEADVAASSSPVARQEHKP